MLSDSIRFFLSLSLYIGYADKFTRIVIEDHNLSAFIRDFDVILMKNDL